MPTISAGDLWTNGCDSLVHALTHFSERKDRHADEEHDDKWIVMSVHHAAECICNMRLHDLAPEHRLLARPLADSVRVDLAVAAFVAAATAVIAGQGLGEVDDVPAARLRSEFSAHLAATFRRQPH